MSCICEAFRTCQIKICRIVYLASDSFLIVFIVTSYSTTTVSPIRTLGIVPAPPVSSRDDDDDDG